VRRLVWLLNKVRHSDDFILLVIFDHFSLLNDRHEILGMADLALESTPDLRNILLAHVILLNINIWQRTRFATTAERLRMPTWSRDRMGSDPSGLIRSV
jgi:hypothetical protein